MRELQPVQTSKHQRFKRDRRFGCGPHIIHIHIWQSSVRFGSSVQSLAIAPKQCCLLGPLGESFVGFRTVLCSVLAVRVSWACGRREQAQGKRSAALCRAAAQPNRSNASCRLKTRESAPSPPSLPASLRVCCALLQHDHPRRASHAHRHSPEPVFRPRVGATFRGDFTSIAAAAPRRFVIPSSS